VRVRISGVHTLVFTFIFSYFGFLMRFDPDIHHDGIMFTPAVAFSEGLLPNRDVFAYYGPGSPIIQGLAIRILGANVYSLRILGAAVFALSFTLVFYLLKKKFSASWALTFTLLGAIPAASILPWSTAFTTLANLICLTLLIRSMIAKDQRLIKFLVIAASFIIGLSFYIRIHQIFVSFTVLIYLFFVRKDKRQTSSWFVGLILSHVLVLLLMFLNGMATGFLWDCIIYPQSVAIIKTFEISYFVGLLWYPLLSIITIAHVILIKRAYRKSLLQTFIITIMSLILGYVGYRVSHLPRTGWVTYRNPKIVAIDGFWLSNVLIGYFSATAVLILGLKFLVDKKSKISSENSLGIFLALGVLPQLYPMYDRMHLWLITPVLMIPALFYLADSRFWNSNTKNSTKFVALSLLALQVFTIAHFVGVKRAVFDSPSLIHMLATPESVKRIDPSVQMLSHFKDEKMVFNCNNAFYAAAIQEFQSSSKYYVNWGKAGKETPEVESKYIFICNLTRGEFKKYEKGGQVVDFRELEYEEPEGKVLRYNIISTEQNDRI